MTKLIPVNITKYLNQHLTIANQDYLFLTQDPSLAIPRGTLLAIALTYVTYMYFGLQTSFVFNKRASGVSEEYR